MLSLKTQCWWVSLKNYVEGTTEQNYVEDTTEKTMFRVSKKKYVKDTTENYIDGTTEELCNSELTERIRYANDCFMAPVMYSYPFQILVFFFQAITIAYNNK